MLYCAGSRLLHLKGTTAMFNHTLHTIDGREITESELRMIFDAVCDWNMATDAEFHWKETLAYEITFTSADQVNDIMSAIVFFVGGRCNTFMWRENGIDMIEISNRGYYHNIGA
jgi:hypothetical protein